MKRSHVLACAFAGVFAMLPALSRAAEPTVLRFGFPAPPASKVHVWGTGPWAEDVMKASGGTLDIKHFYGTAIVSIRTTYDRTVSGVSDITFGLFGPLAGLFKKVDVTDLPFESDTDVETSLALWRLYKQGLLDQSLDKVKVLSLFVFPPALFNTNKPVESAADIKGLKFAMSSRLLAEFVSRLGGSPVTLGAPEFYQAAARGVVDGVLVGWTSVSTFKLYEVTKYHLITGVGHPAAFIFMNKQAYARLPAKAKAAIDKYSGEPYFKRMGEVTDRMNEEGEKAVRAMKGQTVSTISPEIKARWKELTKSLTEAWVKRTPDGARVLAAFRKAVADIRAGK